MSDHYPDEALNFPVTNIADIIRIKLDETLLTNDASQNHRLYALALALAWRLKSYPMAERVILPTGQEPTKQAAGMAWVRTSQRSGTDRQ